MGKFLLLSGSHAEKQADGSFRIYDAPPADSDVEVIVESPDDLQKAFGKHRFRRLPASMEASRPTRVSNPPPSFKHEVGGDLNAPLGQDVTEQFEEASTHDLRVYQGPTGFFVTKDDDRTTRLNDKPLKTNKQVEKYLTEYTATHSADQE